MQGFCSQVLECLTRKKRTKLFPSQHNITEAIFSVYLVCIFPASCKDVLYSFFLVMLQEICSRSDSVQHDCVFQTLPSCLNFPHFGGWLFQPSSWRHLNCLTPRNGCVSDGTCIVHRLQTEVWLYVSGFIMMTPQLFINYKLKSVAHLPWRMLTYKALNTFIDDIFAFVIKMPTLYRLGCLRDGQCSDSTHPFLLVIVSAVDFCKRVLNVF